MDSVKTKDLARALFTPSKKLDTSCDSVNPLDSTCEDESCDLSADQGLANQSVDDVELSDLNIEGGNKQNVATLQNVSDVNLVMDVSKKAISGESYSNSPILDKDDMHLKDTSTDNINTTTMASSSPDKLQAISPLQNLVTSDLRPLNTSLNESTDSVKMLNKYQLPKAELKEHTPERVVDSDSKASNFCNDKASSPMMSPTNSENTAALITSPTFSQKSARKRNKIVSERSPTSSPRFSIDCALSDFFDPPSSAVGRRKRAPKKRKSTEMDTSSEFEVSDISIKCSTPKENMTLQSILSSKKKGKRSVKKVRFSDAVLTKKVTFSLENEEIEVDLKDSTHEYLVLKKEDKSNAEDVKQSRKELSKVKVEKTIKHEISADTMVTDENVKDKHREVGDLQNSDNKDRQMGLPVKSSNRENLTYCKRRGLKMRSKKECRDDAGKNMLFDSRLDKSGDRTIDKSDTNMNLSETTNNSKRNSDISEDSEAFSQVSPSALTEMCDIAQSASGDATITGGHHETALSSRNNNSNHSTKMKETLISKSHSLVKNKAKLPVPKKILNASPIEKSVQPVLNNKQPQVTVPRKFFYPSSKQIGTAHSKKVFEYKHENDRTENAGLVKSVCVKDIILKPDIDTEKQGDAGNIIDAEKEMDADKQKDGGKKKDAEKPNDAWKSVDAESDRMRNNHIKARGVKDDHADQINTNGKNDDFLVVNDCYYLKILYTVSERCRKNDRTVRILIRLSALPGAN